MEYQEYVNLMERQLRNRDVRERVFQDNIIRPFLQSVFQNLDIEPVDVKINSEEHEYEQYCGTYINKKNIELPATPDLCISDEWYWNNREVVVNYRGVVEIKSPILDYITGIEPQKYNCLSEIQRHLTAKRNSKVILTDGVTWVFYNKDNGLTPIIRPLCLGKLVYKYNISKNNRLVVARTSGNKPIVEKIEFAEEKEYMRLIDEIRRFIMSDVEI